MRWRFSPASSSASGPRFGKPWCARCSRIYVEVVRGTPVLLQLFVLYYGLFSVIRLPAFIAALLGLGLNYTGVRKVRFIAARWRPYRADSSKPRERWG